MRKPLWKLFKRTTSEEDALAEHEGKFDLAFDLLRLGELCADQLNYLHFVLDEGKDINRDDIDSVSKDVRNTLLDTVSVPLGISDEVRDGR